MNKIDRMSTLEDRIHSSGDDRRWIIFEHFKCVSHAGNEKRMLVSLVNQLVALILKYYNLYYNYFKTVATKIEKA